MKTLFTLLLLFVFSGFVDGQCNAPPVFLGNDTSVCAGDPLLLDAASNYAYERYEWSTGESNSSIQVSQTGTYWVNAYELGVNLTHNPGFENGNTGFSSAYTYHPTPDILGSPYGSIYNEGTYTVYDLATTPVVHLDFLDLCTDHTTGNGNMMMINGTVVANVNIWCDSFNVQPNTNYQLSAWVSSLTSGNPAQLQFRIAGGIVGSVFSPTTNTCEWVNHIEQWNSGMATYAKVCIVNQNINSGGNDFALDDITFRPVCVYTDTIQITSIPGPVVNLGQSQSFCDVSSPYILDAGNPGSTFLWSTGETTQTIAVTNTGTYGVTASNGTCTSTDQVNISFNPGVDLGPDLFLCPGQSQTLNAANPLSYENYLWSTGATTATINVSQSGTYWVETEKLGSSVITNGDFELGNTDFTSDYIFAPVPPGVYGSLSNEGTYGIYVNPALGHANFATCSDHTSGSGNMMVCNGSPDPNTNVWCQTVNVDQNTEYQFSAWATTVVGNNAPQLQFEINNSILGAIFTPPTNNCQWNQFFQTWNSGINTTAQICILNQNTAGGGNDFALDDITFRPICVTRDSVNVSFNGVVANLGPDQSICGTSTTLDAGNPGASYAWNTSQTSQTISPTSSGTYSVTITGNGGCTDSDTVNVMLTPPPNAGPNGAATFCQSEGVVNLNLFLDPSAQTNGTWNDPNGATQGNLNSQGMLNASTLNGVYTLAYIKMANNCPNETALYTIQVHPNPVVNLGSNQTLCANSPLFLNAGNSGATYQWSTNENTQTISVQTSGQYSVLVTATSGCTGADTVVLTFHPVADAGPDSTLLFCEMDSVVDLDQYLTSQAQSGGIWSNPGNSLNGAVALNGNLNLVNANGMHQVLYRVSSGVCPRDTAVYTLHITATPMVNLGLDTVLCIGETLVLDAQNSGSSYLWNTNETNQTIQVSTSNTYSVEVDNNGCVGRDTIEVQFLAPPNAGANNNAVFCQSENPEDLNTYLDPSANAGGIWYDSLNSMNGQLSSQGFLATASLIGNYTAYYIAQAGNCPNDTALISLNVEPTPQVNLGEEIIVCSGTSITLDAGNVGGIYLWSDNSSNQTLDVFSSGIYFVTVSTLSGCSDSDTVQVSFGAQPNAGPDTTLSFCQNENTIDLDSYRPLGSQNGGTWVDNGSTNGNLSMQGMLNVANLNGSFTLYYIKTGLNCPVDSATYTVSVFPNPVIDLGTDQNLCEGSSVTLDAQNAGATFVWNTGDLTQTIQPTSTGWFAVTVTNAGGCSESDTVNLTFYPSPQAGLDSSLSYCQSVGSVDLFTQLQSQADVSGTWYDGNGMLAGSLDNFGNLDVTNLNGTYSLIYIVSGANCPNDTAHYSLVVASDAPVDLGPDQSVCQGEVIVLNAGNPGSTYSWSNGAQSQTIQPTTSGIYSVSVVTPEGCSGGDEVTLNFSPAPFAGQDLNLDFCQSDGLVNLYNYLSGSAQGSGTFQNPSNSAGIAYQGNGNLNLSSLTGNHDFYYIKTSPNCPNDSALYSVTVYENPSVDLGPDQNVCATNVITLDAQNAGATYQWSTGETTQSIQALSSGNYQVTVTTGGICSANDNVNINYNPAPNAGSDSALVFCNNMGSVNLLNHVSPSAESGGSFHDPFNASNGALQFNTLTTSTTAGTFDLYYVKTGVACPNDSATYQITINRNPYAGLDANEHICRVMGDQLDLNSLTTPIQNVGTPYWEEVGNNAGVEFDPSSGVLNTGNLNQGGYDFLFIMVADSTCQNDTATISLQLSEIPIVDFSADETNGCEPMIVNFTNSSTYNGITEFEWNFGNGIQSTLENPSSVTFNTAGLYTVSLKITVDNLCTDELVLTDLVEVYGLPIAEFNFQSTDLSAENPATTMINLSSNYTSSFWDFGDGINSTDDSPDHTFPLDHGGEYQVTLIVSNDGGCVDSVSYTIGVKNPDMTYFVPTAFTPDGDQFNQYFKPVMTAGFEPASYRMEIYNRWGELLFVTQDLETGWDGTYKNVMVQSGVYVWKIYFTDLENDEKYEQIGQVSLLR
ncbi:MAG: PKD domain-containing protein [Crocinitomicaceae bacterium]|jgi:gliding motility-associated-like protein|nr:PKD domain-containing protein [Crocinitomicaceae bacterium]